MTFRLRVVSGVGLTGPDAQDVRAVLAQPKRLALLVYLAVARPAGFHRRDTLLALFWPEADEDGARASLSRALHHLRQALGASVIVSRGDDEVAVDRTKLTSDVLEIADALARGEPAAALSLYTSEFLHGFHVDDVAGFDHWVEGERDRIRTSMGTAASEASRAAERGGDLVAASTLARRACELSPYSESTVLELMRILAAQGNRADALLACEAFTNRLRDDLETSPGAALVVAAHRLRQGHPATAGPVWVPPEVPPSRPAPVDPSAMPPSSPRLAGRLGTALAIYIVTAVAVTVIASVAIDSIGLPDWVLPGAMLVMALGLPAVLWTGYVHVIAQRSMEPSTSPEAAARAPEPGALARFALKAAPRTSWKQTVRGGAFALAALVVAVAGFMAMRALGVGPPATLLSAGKLSRQDPLLLADFRISNADSSLGRVASDAVRQALLESSVITIVSPTAVAAAMKRAQRAPSSALDLPLARDLAARLGLKAIIDGEVAGVPGGYLVTLRLVGADSLSPLAIFTAGGQGPQGFIQAVDRVTRAFRAKAGESLRRVRRAPPLSDATTGSLEALRMYSAALRAYGAGELAKAEALGRRATSIDTGFAVAWLKLPNYISGAAVLSGRPWRAASDSALAHAYASRARLGERERFALVVTLGYRSGREHVIAAAESLLALGHAEDSASVLLDLGRWYATRQDFARADSMMVRSLQVDSTFMATNLNRVWWLYQGGRFAEAKAAAQLFARRFPASPLAQQMVRDVFWHEGRFDEVRRQADSIDAAPSAVPMQGWARSTRMALAVREGRLAAWQRLVVEGHRADSTHGVSPTLLGASVTSGVESVVRGPGPRAAGVMDAALRAQPLRSLPEAERPYFAIAIAYARAGYPDRARAVLAEYDSDVKDTVRRRVNVPYYHQASGEIELAEHHPVAAVPEFRKGFTLADGPLTNDDMTMPLDLARAFDAAGEADSAVVKYERYLSTPGVFARFGLERDASWLPFVHSRLAALYEARGETTRAAAHYRAFIELWRDADPELQPRVEAARHRLAMLRAAEEQR